MFEFSLPVVVMLLIPRPLQWLIRRLVCREGLVHFRQLNDFLL